MSDLVGFGALAALVVVLAFAFFAIVETSAARWATLAGVAGAAAVGGAEWRLFALDRSVAEFALVPSVLLGFAAMYWSARAVYERLSVIPPGAPQGGDETEIKIEAETLEQQSAVWNELRSLPQFRETLRGDLINLASGDLLTWTKVDGARCVEIRLAGTTVLIASRFETLGKYHAVQRAIADQLFPSATVVRAVQEATREAAERAADPGPVLQIRPLEAGDLSALLDLYAHLHRSDDPLPGDEVVAVVWQKILARPGHTVFGGWLGDMLVSSCALTIIPNLTRGCRPYGVLENVVTHADHRNRGHGKAILAHALAHAWAGDCYKVMLLTGKRDEATRRFYESAGFNGDEKRGFVAKPPAAAGGIAEITILDAAAAGAWPVMPVKSKPASTDR